MRTLRIVGSLKDRFRPPSGYRVWIFPGLPLSICVASLTAIGPSLQAFAFSALNSTAPSIYDAMYDEQLVTWPRLDAWLFDLHNLMFLGVGAAAGLLSLRHGTIRRIAASVAGWVALLLTLLDFAFETSSAWAPGTLAGDAAANIVGGIGTGLIVFFALACSRLVRGAIAPANAWWLQGGTIVAIGLLVDAAAYYGFSFLYQPTPVRIDATLTPPVNGMIASGPADLHARDGAAEQETQRSFSVPADSWIFRKVSMMTPRLPLSIGWHPGGGTKTLELRIFDDCFWKGPNELPDAPITLALDATRPIALRADAGGYVEMTDVGPLVFQSKSADDPTLFTLAKGEKGSPMQITRMDGAPRRVRISDSRGARYAISITTLDLKAPRRSRSTRTIVIRTPTGTKTLRFEPQGELDGSTRQSCTPIRLPKPTMGDVGNHAMTLPARGIGITLDMRTSGYSEADIPHFKAGPAMTISGVSGWTTAQHPMVEADDVDEAGALRYVSFQGGVSDFQIDGKPNQVRLFDTVIAQGSISGKFLGGRSLNLQGRADQLWRNGRRMNPTRWERSSTELQLAILSALGALVLTLWTTGRSLATRFANDAPD